MRSELLAAGDSAWNAGEKAAGTSDLVELLGPLLGQTMRGIQITH